MELQFTQEADGRWAAAFTATGPYALHVERAEAAPMSLYQRHGGAADSLWANCRLPGEVGAAAGAVWDEAFDHGVYPVEVRLVSALQPTIATLAYDSTSNTGGGEAAQP